jgi:hypothetical protein
MKELLDRLSQYNLFNYLLPGALFAVLIEKVSTFRLVQEDIVTGLLIYYFTGLVVSRVGSLILEPLMKLFNFVSFAPYRDFVCACVKDTKLEVLSEANNTYRTLAAAFLCLELVAAGDRVAYSLEISRGAQKLVVLVLLFVLFAFSYRKQTAYVRQRVEANI